MAQELTGLEYLKKKEIKNMKCNMEKPFAFISYSHDDYDSQIVMNVFKQLMGKGYNLWIDTANMPVDEHDWKESARKALRNKNCKIAVFFRSESSMVKSTIAKELGTIVILKHIKSIVTVDIWHEEGMNADEYYAKVYNDGSDEEIKALDKICEAVSTECKAIRLAGDAGNDILRLVEELEEELQAIEGVYDEQLPEEKKADTVKNEIEKTQEVYEPDKTQEMQEKSTTTQTNGSTESGKQSILLNDFFDRYDYTNFRSNTFATIRLVGSGNYTQYSTKTCESPYELVWEFVKQQLEKRGLEYVEFVTAAYRAKNPQGKNPPFITAQEHAERIERNDSVKYRKLDVKGLDAYSMNRHYSAYNWLADALKKRMQELKLPFDAFYFEYVPGSGSESVEPPKEKRESKTVEQKPEGTEITGGITGPVSLTGNSHGGAVEQVCGTYSLTEFLKKYGGETFQGSSCNTIQLLGRNGNECFSTGQYKTARELVVSFTMKRLDELGVEYIKLVNGCYETKNPLFITIEEHRERKNKKHSVQYMEVTSKKASGYSFNVHYSEYNWLKDSLMKQLKALGLSAEEFDIVLG